MAADMAKYGVMGIEAHYPSEVKEDNFNIKDMLF